MESKTPPLLMFDDLCRANSRFTDCNDLYDGIFNILSCLEEWRKRWVASQLELQNVRKLQADLIKGKIESETKLSHTQMAFEAEMQRRIKAEHERDYFKRQVEAARILLTNDPNGINEDATRAFLDTNSKDSIQRLTTINESNGSINWSGDFSYDRTADYNIDESNDKEMP